MQEPTVLDLIGLILGFGSVWIAIIFLISDYRNDK